MTYIGLSVIRSSLAAVQDTLFSESLPREVRYTLGCSFTGGETAPLVAEYLTSYYQSTYPVVVYLVVAASISVIAVLKLNKK